MKILREIYHLFIGGKTDKKVEEIMREPMNKLEETNQTIKKVNRLMSSKTVTYKIAQAVGQI